MGKEKICDNPEVKAEEIFRDTSLRGASYDEALGFADKNSSSFRTYLESENARGREDILRKLFKFTCGGEVIGYAYIRYEVPYKDWVSEKGEKYNDLSICIGGDVRADADTFKKVFSGIVKYLFNESKRAGSDFLVITVDDSSPESSMISECLTSLDFRSSQGTGAKPYSKYRKDY